jgi:hypothetical protein
MGRPVALQVGPLAAASANNISTSQKSTGTYLVLNGSTGTATANNVCLSQTPGGAGALTLNGALAKTTGYIIPSAGGVAGVIVASGTAAAYLPAPQRIYITGGSDESGKTFTVLGYVFPQDGVGGPVAVTETITGPNASTVSSANVYAIIVSITVSAGTTGAITVGTYGTATLDTARRVLFTSAGNDSGITFAIAGTDENGQSISEAVTGANASTAATALNYATVTSIKPSAAVASTLTVGTNGVASRMVRLDDYASNAQAAIAVVVSGTVNYSVQTSMDDPGWLYSGITPQAMSWIDSTDSAVVSATATKSSTLTVAPLFVRLLLNSGTGTATLTIRQAYLG